MIVGNNAVAPTLQGVATTARATIKASARLFDFFANQIYADKYVAIIRELVSNGMDSHVAAGNTDVSVEVTLPTTFTPYMKVRDFGTGMSRDFLLGPFMAYTDASTKSDSNDFIGGFGIGSKAPLSYTDQFAIHSYQAGKLSIYSIFKDDDGCPAIAFLAESETEEADGIEISFPIDQKDIENFRNAAYKTLNYFSPLPVLKNAAKQLEAPEYTVKTELWGFRKGSNTSQIIQGGVAYEIEASSVPQRLHEILGFGVDFFVPIGTVGISLSRERLSYDDNTIKVITTLVETIQPKIQEHINEMFKSYPNRWTAIREYGSMVNNRSPATRLIEQLAQYEGEKLERSIEPVMADKVLIACISSNRYNKTGNWSTSRLSPPFGAWMSRIAPRDVVAVVIDDGPAKPILRCRAFLETVNEQEGVIFFRSRPTEKVDWPEFIKALGSPEVVMLSTIEPAVVTRGQGSTRAEKIRAYKGSSTTSDFVDVLPDTGGYYVQMENFNLVGITKTQIAALKCGDKPLYYFNKGDFEKIKGKPEWVSAAEALKQQLLDYRKKTPNIHLTDAFHDLLNRNYRSKLGHIKGLLDLAEFKCPKRGPLNKIKTIYETVRPNLTSEDASTRELLGIKSLKQQLKLQALIEETFQKYPELYLIINQNYVRADYVGVYNKLV